MFINCLLQVKGWRKIKDETFEVIDSVDYDTHEPQDYFRRIKTV